MSTMRCSLLALGCIFGFIPSTYQNKLTALRALKIAQRRLRPEVRASLLSVSSSRSGDSLIPDAWRFLFLDPTTSGNCRVVTVAARASSEHPDTVEAFSNMKIEEIDPSSIIAQNKLEIDSDQILQQALTKLDKINGVEAEFSLKQGKGESHPLWNVRFFSKTNEEIANYTLNATTGDVSQESSKATAAV